MVVKLIPDDHPDYAPKKVNPKTGKFQSSANREYGAEAVRILGMIAGQEESEYLTNRDRAFIKDMKGKMQVAGSGFVCNEAQLHWLRDLKDRLVENGEV